MGRACRFRPRLRRRLRCCLRCRLRCRLRCQPSGDDYRLTVVEQTQQSSENSSLPGTGITGVDTSDLSIICFMTELKTVPVASGPQVVHPKVSNNSKAQPKWGFGRRKVLGVNGIPLSFATTISKILQHFCINISFLHFFWTPATFVWSATVNRKMASRIFVTPRTGTSIPPLAHSEKTGYGRRNIQIRTVLVSVARH